MKITFTKKHHLVTEKYGHLDLDATIELDTETDTPNGMSWTMRANELLDEIIEPTLDRINRSLDVGDQNTEFIRAYTTAREV